MKKASRIQWVILWSTIWFFCQTRAGVKAAEWFDFNPPADAFTAESVTDLRGLNEAEAGQHGFIGARGSEFIRKGDGQAVRFWAVNGPHHEAPDQLARTARLLAKNGVNLARLHGAVFDEAGTVDLKKVGQSREIIAALKKEGIYSHLSIYFPLWFKPSTSHPWMKGYNGNTHPFAALLFNPEFQQRYREWWKALLVERDASGKRLVDDPALMGLEIQNEDSFFFWTFNPDQIPDAQMRILEARFGDWAGKKYGSLEAASQAWKSQGAKRDNFAEGRVGFRPLYNVFTEKSARDRDAATFLFETQRDFYRDTARFLRELGFKGVITASNWATASPEVFGPLEKLSYCEGDFIDRHGYFSVTHKGPESAWSIRNGHTYADRSALRFDPETPGKARQFVHPAMDPEYDGKPSMISETTWNRPNRYRSEAPLYFAAYGALQGTDAIVHFAFDGSKWSVKPGYWMQPWTLMAPSQVAQFPAAALIYRLGLVRTGETLARLDLNTTELVALKGTPLPQDASFDELRLKDVPQGQSVAPGQRIDPLIHYAGRVEVRFTNAPGKTVLGDLKPLVQRERQMVRSSTGELELDYGKGLLKINAVAAQGASGDLKSAGRIELKDLSIESGLDNGHIVVVALDQRPLGESKRMLLQVMSEERATGFATEPGEAGVTRIKDIGRDPWQVKALEGSVRFKGPAEVRMQPLDFNGYAAGQTSSGPELKLDAKTIYYLITR